MLDRHIIPCYNPFMEIRLLRYFIAVAVEGSFSRAANRLHVTQPTLSRQIRDLEEELGCTLFKRGSHSVGLTPEGHLLRRRAEDILGLVEHTKREFRLDKQALGGEVSIGAGESDAFRQLARAACGLRQRRPGVMFHLYSGNKEDVVEKLDKGLLDFGLIIHPADISHYHSLPLGQKDVWGVVMSKDSPLAGKGAVTRDDLAGVPLLVSRQVSRTRESGNALLAWLGGTTRGLQVAATYNLIYNAALMVREGLGYALALDKLVPCGDNSPLCFRPLSPPVESGLSVVWTKGRPLSAAAMAFLECLRRELSSGNKGGAF